ncbi:MAG: MBL fold metallo-hydrolase [Desulfurococcales archaeon]|nr:MBL fold metallo-hydrolase [Desulfurococcales archaeon]MCE4626451.1 MBL fold metallo-hydrolase [Desulfurococcales archaeon]MCE4628737.1 MBL fold metallo-hydrolase [Desulfurococcales archaeon]
MASEDLLDIHVERRETMEFPLTTPSNYYIVRYGDEKILVDAGARKLDKSLGEEVAAVILTHWHWDHTYGITGLEEPVICTGPETGEILSSLDTIVSNVYKPLEAMGLKVEELGGPVGHFFNMIKNLYSEIVEAYNSGKKHGITNCPGIRTVEAFPCPGHNDDHQCIRLGNYIFVGDNVTIGESPTTINYRDYLVTIHKILASEWQYLAPGHGRIMERPVMLEYFNNVVDRKNRKMIKVLSLVSKGVGDFNKLLKQVYGVDPVPQSYVQARTLIGYLRLLEDYGVIEIDYDKGPWRVNYMGE